MPKIWQVTKIEMKSVKTVFLNFLISLGTILLVVSSTILAFTIAYNGKAYPNISVNDIKISGNSQEKTLSILQEKVTPPKQISLIYQDQTYEVFSQDIDLKYNLNETANNAYNIVRSGNFPVDLLNKINLFIKPVNINLVYTINESKLDKFISIIAGQISTDEIKPSATIVNNAIVINKGSAGKEVDQNKLTQLIKNTLATASDAQIQIPVIITDNTITEETATDFGNRASKIIGKSLLLKFEYNSLTLNDNDLVKLIAPNEKYYDDQISQIIQKVAKLIERDPQNAKFVFENGKVTEFEPALDGIKVDSDSLKNVIISNIKNLEDNNDTNIVLEIPVIKKLPDTSTNEVNNFGIKELIGRGTSTYFHSIPGRVHNVALAASRINGTLVKPGETFSFNSTLGDVSAFTGYQQAYIISEGKTILGDGGGVCQVSSTLFRAVLDAGLPINERTAHAYRVGYYEQGSSPGFDATVYSPSPDFKFTNDTKNYILIEAVADTKNYSLVFELYGTKDGRTISISKPVVTNITAPPADVYQDDPTLPTGTVKQIDYKAWGAKVTFRYVVSKNGQEIINKTFVSNYKPWAAVYLRGTGPIN